MRCIIDLRATAFRGDDLEEVWAPYAALALSFGASAYSFARAEEDPLHFIHTSDWPNPEQFEHYWNSLQMIEARQRAAGLYQVPVVPHWAELIAHGGA